MRYHDKVVGEEMENKSLYSKEKGDNKTFLRIQLHNPWKKRNLYFSQNSEKWLKTTTVLSFISFLLLSSNLGVDSNPLAKHTHSGPVSNNQSIFNDNNNNSNANFINGASNRTSERVDQIHGSSSPFYEEEQLQALPKPSGLTFKVNRFCQADVSQERVICNNIKKRSDLPQKEKWFVGVQQALFVNISAGSSVDSDIRLEDLKSLFPNLVVLGISQSPYIAASLINLQGTKTARRWELTEAMAPKSLLQDPHFARRLNLNYFSSHMQKPTTTSLNGWGGERMLFVSPATATGSTTTTGTSISPTSALTGFGSGALQDSNESNDIHFENSPSNNNNIDLDRKSNKETDEGESFQSDAGIPESPQKLRRFVWDSVKHLNLSWNELTSDALPDFLANIFPNVEIIDLSNNYLTKLDKLRDANWPRLESMDVSG